MDSTGIEALQHSVIESLEAVSRSTEAVYGKMGETYPSLVKELDAAEGQASRADLAPTIGAALGTIQDQEGRFHQGHDESRRMLDRLGGQMTSLGSLGQCIDKIREDSILMELISLNAMVIAVKAGEAGRAFSTITTELKQVSNQTRSLTDRVSADEGSLDGVFSTFKGNLEEQIEKERKGFATFLAGIRLVFEALATGSRNLFEGLSNIHSRSDAVKGPLVKIMVEIQNQDRIRQSIDHVLLSLGEFHAAADEENWQARLDELSFLEILPELSSQVLEEISGQIKSNRTVFQGALSQARELVATLEREHNNFVSKHLDSHHEGSLEHAFSRGEQLFSEYVSEHVSLSRVRESAFRRSGQLQSHVGGLVDSLGSFEELLGRFRNIDLASRIQVARQSALASMKDNASEMSDLTRRIESDVREAIGVTREFSTTVETLFEEYRHQFEGRTREDEAFQNRLHQAMAGLRAAKERLGRAVQESRVFTTAFTGQFSLTEADLNTLDELMLEIDKQRTSLASIRERITDQKRQLMEEHGLAEWNLGSEQLKMMIERFTIFTHKKIAAELGNFEVEESVESGDVTLF